MLVLIGLVTWQLMWMNDVVDNYEANKSYKVPDLKKNIKDDKVHNKGTNTLITDQSVVQEAGTILDSPGINMKSEIDKLEKEEQLTVVSDRISDVDNKEVKRISANESPSEIHSQGSRQFDGDRQNIAPSRNEKVTVGKEDITISIKIKGNTPLLPQKQVIAESPISSSKTINLQSQSVTQHATCTSPY